MSEPVHVGRVDEGTGTADIWRHEAGTVEVISDGRIILSPRGTRQLAGLLDRAAMPGLTGASPVLDMDCRGGNCGACIGPPGTRCECPCHALTVAAVTPALAERMGEIADAAQEAHEHSFPVQPPHGSLLAPGPCACGKTWAIRQAEGRLAAALAALTVARREAGDG